MPNSRRSSRKNLAGKGTTGSRGSTSCRSIAVLGMNCAMPSARSPLQVNRIGLEPALLHYARAKFERQTGVPRALSRKLPGGGGGGPLRGALDTAQRSGRPCCGVAGGGSAQRFSARADAAAPAKAVAETPRADFALYPAPGSKLCTMPVWIPITLTSSPLSSSMGEPESPASNRIDAAQIRVAEHRF
jgi:hypothetical protein